MGNYHALNTECMNFIIAEMRSGDFVTFKNFQEEVYLATDRYLDSWELFLIGLEDSQLKIKIEQFIGIVRSRIEYVKHYQVIYSKHDSWIKKISDKNIFSIKKLDVQHQEYHNLINQFIDEGNEIKQKINVNKQWVSLFDRIKASNSFRNREQWGSVFQLLQNHLHKEEQSEYKFAFIKHLQMEETPQKSCLGCASFFHEGINIKEDGQTPVLTIEIQKTVGKIQFEEKQKYSLLKNVCALASSRGGVILLDCQDKPFGIFPVGRRLTQKQKGSLEEKIKGIIKHGMIEDIFLKVNFVPIKQNPYKHQSGGLVQSKDFCRDKKYKQREYEFGRYITRVIVEPKTHKIHKFTYHGIQYCAQFKQGHVVQIQKEQKEQWWQKQTKRKKEIESYGKQLCNSNYSGSQYLFSAQQVSCFQSLHPDQNCKQPESGHKDFSDKSYTI